MSEIKVVPDLYELAFMPGQFRCPECGFQLSKQTMSVTQGRIGTTPENRESEPCPNDGVMMVHVTYREQLEAYAARLDEELRRNDIRPPEMSLQEAGRRTHATQISLEAILDWMSQKGQSVELNWGEDNNSWECSWITGGIRYSGFDRSIRSAITAAQVRCFDAAIKEH